MTNNELKLLQSAMDHSKSYLEFGSGNSTYMAVATDNIKKITVVESDVTFWETHLMSTPAIYEAVEKGRLHPYLVNIGVTGKWGYSYDTVLVDGRFRISCILHACLYCPQDTKILIHDFFNRPNYYVVLPFLKLEERADTLGLFSIKQDTSLKHLAKEYISIYEYLPGF